MFQYAFFKQMQHWHGKGNVKLDIDTYTWSTHNGRELDKVFNLDLRSESVPARVSLDLADVGYKVPHRILRRIRGRKHKSYRFWKDIDFEEYKDLHGDVYLEGFWNEERFFRDVKELVRDIYTIRADLSPRQEDILKDIETSESIGVHVRRGDYVKYPDLFPMCTPQFYMNALHVVKEKYEDVRCFVFSDDLSWCKENLHFLDKVTFVQNKIGIQAYIDMMLMSKCKHNIIANSTFSWWAAWLNKHSQSIVVYPGSVQITYASMPGSWILISSK